MLAVDVLERYIDFVNDLAVININEVVSKVVITNHAPRFISWSCKSSSPYF